MVLDSVNGPEPADGSFVYASDGRRLDRTVWERDDDLWYCLCCGGRSRWDQLVKPIETVAPKGYHNGKYGFAPNQ